VESACANDSGSDGIIPYNVSPDPTDNAMDCGGVCLNSYVGGDAVSGQYGSYLTSKYVDEDGDGWGTGSAITYCTAEAIGIGTGYANNAFDVDDKLKCFSNAIDCAGVCGGSALKDDCGNCSAAENVTQESGAPSYAGDASVYGSGNAIFAAYNTKYNVATGIQLSATPEVPASSFIASNDLGYICECNSSASTLADYKTVDCAGACAASPAKVMKDFYFDYDGDGSGGVSYAILECKASGSTTSTYNTITTSTNNADSDDSCFSNSYDGCNVCSKLKASDSSNNPAYLSTITSSCIGSSSANVNPFVESACANDSGSDGIIPYN
ncbi:uncharacterized protein METZ01_LOCUS346186, partial [marine metagenome]